MEQATPDIAPRLRVPAALNRTRPRTGERTCRRPRPRDEWVAVPVPAIIGERTRQQAQAQLARNAVLSFRDNTRHDYLPRCLLTCRNVEWSTIPSVLMGVGVMAFALADLNWAFDPVRLLAFAVLFVSGVAIAYGFLLMLTASSVWLMRNQSLYEIWWLFTTLIRYPADIFAGSWAYPVGWFFTFVVPILLVVNVPANVMVKALEPGFVALTLVVAVVLLWVSRRVFRAALRRYRSASS